MPSVELSSIQFIASRSPLCCWELSRMSRMRKMASLNDASGTLLKLCAVAKMINFMVGQEREAAGQERVCGGIIEG